MAPLLRSGAGPVLASAPVNEPLESDAQKRRKKADQIAAGTFVVVGLVGLLLVVVPVLFNFGPLGDDPFAPREQVETTETQELDGAGEPTKTTKRTVTKPASESFLERALAPSGVLLLRLAVVAVAAVIAGAIAQRVVLGEYAFELAGLKVPQLSTIADETEKSLGKVTATVEAQGDLLEALSLEVQQLVSREGPADEEREP